MWLISDSSFCIWDYPHWQCAQKLANWCKQKKHHKPPIWEWVCAMQSIYLWWFGGWFSIVLHTLIIMHDYDTSDYVRHSFQDRKWLGNCDNASTPSEEITTWVSLLLHAHNGQQPCLTKVCLDVFYSPEPACCEPKTQYAHSNPQNYGETIHHHFSRILLFYPS